MDLGYYCYCYCFSYSFQFRLLRCVRAKLKIEFVKTKGSLGDEVEKYVFAHGRMRKCICCRSCINKAVCSKKQKNRYTFSSLKLNKSVKIE